MAEREVRYCTTEDGVRIAYLVEGSGPPLVWLTDIPGSHILREWDLAVYRSVYVPISAKRSLVRFDSRGLGMSDRGVGDVSIASRVRDLEAVVDALGLETFDLHGEVHGGVIAVTYAAAHPERVSKLILCDSFAKASDYSEAPYYETLRDLLMRDWEMWSENVGSMVFGWNDEEARKFGAYLRDCVSYDMAVRSYLAFLSLDLLPLLPQIQCPTLVLWHGTSKHLSTSMGLRLGEIPGATVAMIPGTWRENAAAVLKVMGDFLGDEYDLTPVATTTRAEPVGALRTVLFTDLVGHTEMMSRLGDERGRAVLREHERITRDVLRTRGGTEIKTMGDGFMASFGSVTSAVECAIALQRAFAEQEGEPLNVRVGLNAGEPIEEDGDLFGATVILASRIAAKAEGGEILVADTVRGLCSGKGFLFADRGEFVAKGFEEPVRVYEVRWRAD